MHIAGANGTDILLTFPFPNGENQKNVPAAGVFPIAWSRLSAEERAG